MFDFLLQNWISVAIIAAFVIYAAYLVITNQWEKIRHLAYKLMLLAERTFRDEDGKIKFDFVARIVYKNLPAWMKIFIKEEDISNLIQKWYDAAKDFLDDGKIDNSTKGVFK